MAYPRYTLPLHLLLNLAWDLLRNKRRSFQTDARRFATGISALHVFGDTPAFDNWPRGWLVTVNHYSRPGFRAWWIAIAIAAVLPAEMHWVITSAWTYPDPLRSHLITPLTEWILARIALTYSFTTVPPMPPRPWEVARRAEAVRRVLRYVRSATGPVVGLAPEGMDSLTGKLTALPPGAGRLIAHLAAVGLRILPVGIFEDIETGALCVRLGPPYCLPSALPDDPEMRDAYVSEVVMDAIANCLPASLKNPCAALQIQNSSR